METGYILGIARGHNGGACLLKDGKIVFAMEEERLSRHKYDGGPFATLMKVKEYTDKIDMMFVAHTQTLENTCGEVDFTGDNVYTGLARKMGLIARDCDPKKHPQVIDLSTKHHITHAASSFYRSGFQDAVAVVVDGAGTASWAEYMKEGIWLWETESIIDCSYPANFKTLYKHQGSRGPHPTTIELESDSERLEEEGTFISVISDSPGITKVYEAITEYCSFMCIEAGKTMGLAPYGKENPNIPPMFTSDFVVPLANRNMFAGLYPHGAVFNFMLLDKQFADANQGDSSDKVTRLQSRRDMAWHCQRDTQDQVVNLIRKAVELSGKKNVVISGGYGLNCVANYHYLEALKDEGINIYVEPISNDAGTAIGAAMLQYHFMNEIKSPVFDNSVYLGPQYSYTTEDLTATAESCGGTVTDATHEDIVELMTNKNIVAVFQGRSENGPRALGNRSLLFDPTFEDGKDFVNLVKRREYFRPFAGSILAEDAHEWFDLRGMKDSPHMMYAVNCQEGVAEKIPSIIHVDGTCRIQTVAREDNEHYYDIIKAFKEKTGIPIVFNTSFNLGGEPLVETLEDAVSTLSGSDIEYLYLPEYGKLITVKNIKFGG